MQLKWERFVECHLFQVSAVIMITITCTAAMALRNRIGVPHSARTWRSRKDIDPIPKSLAPNQQTASLRHKKISSEEEKEVLRRSL